MVPSYGNDPGIPGFRMNFPALSCVANPTLYPTATDHRIGKDALLDGGCAVYSRLACAGQSSSGTGFVPSKIQQLT